MSYLLCHECYTWVEPADGRCPECQLYLDAGRPDLSVDQLQRVLGEVRCQIGEIRIRRRTLPDLGMLYATSRGFYFLPHQMEHVTQSVEAGAAGTSLLWALATLVWFPLIVVLPFVKTNQMKVARVPIYKPRPLADSESPRLPDLLMQNPGVFFVPRKSIRTVERKRLHWKIDRNHGSSLRLKPAADRGQFHQRMAALLASDDWSDLATGR